MTAKDDADKQSGDQKLIRDLALLLNETGLSEIEIEKSGLKVRVARTLTVTAVAAPVHAAPTAGGAAATGTHSWPTPTPHR